MAITTLFGINGVGKDTIAENLRKKNPEITVSSVSRMLMYILGISKTYDVREKVTEEQYKILESIPQTQMVKIENEEYRRILEKIAKEDKKVIFINHLVTAMRHGEDVQYLTKRLTPDWYIDLNENLIQLVAPSNVIAIRRMNDATRVRSSNIEQIEEHQALCSNEWERIMSRGPEVKQKMHIVDNISLERAVEDVENIAIKEKKNIQIDDDIAELLVRSGCYVNANKTNDKLIKAPNGDIIPAYLSCRLAISDVKTRELLERGLIGRVKQEFKDDVTIAGMATAGIPWAHSIAQKLELPMLYVRSSEKAYGLKGLIEGNLKYASKKAIIVDDVLYTGDTVKKAQEVLKQNGIETVGVACIATLRDKIVNDLTKNNIKVINLTHYTNLLEAAKRNHILDEKEYEKYKVADELYMEMPDIMKVTKFMMSYLRGNEKKLSIETEVEGNIQDFFNEKDRLHMADVQGLFLGGLAIRRGAIIVLLFSMAALVLMKADWKRLIPQMYQRVLAVFLALTAVAGFLFSRDFNKYFVIFHHIFFNNNLWILDPAEDYMIRMLPEGFFYDMVMRIGSIFAVFLIVSFVCSIVQKKINKRCGSR